jgi:23S rRNA-/tRNA-specific pseudouridylate synthase
MSKTEIAKLEILYEDDICVAVLKPAALATQAPRGIDSVELRVRALLGQRVAAAGFRDESSGETYLGLPHRLDRAVSGVVLFAKTRRAARTISRQFERRQVRKIYWACVEGRVDAAAAPLGLAGAAGSEPAALARDTWIDFLCKIPDQPRGEIVPPDHPGAQQAVLHYRVLGATPHGSWLEIELETGRMHQIRVQAASRGHPVLGDTLYGSRIAFGPQSPDERQQEIALHAREISFVQPDTQLQIIVVAPCPATWNELGLHEEAK